MRHGLAATLREQRSWKCSTFPLLLSSSAGHILRSARPCSELSPVPSIPPGHGGWRGWEAVLGWLLGTLGICGSAPALIHPGKCRIASSPELCAVQLLPFLAFPFPSASLQFLGA